MQKNIKMRKTTLFILTFLTFIISLTINAQVNLDSGLVAHYPFDGNGIDESDYENDVEEISGAILSTDRFENEESCYSFDGFNDYMSITDADQIDFGSSDEFTISLWVFAPLTQENAFGTVNDIISKWDSYLSTSYSYTVRLNNQNHDFPGTVTAARFDGCGNISKIDSELQINDSAWHHIVFQRLNTNIIRLFVDCSYEGSDVDDLVCDATNDIDLLLGIRSLGSYTRAFTGAIDDLRIYNRALNLEEIELLCSFGFTSDIEEISSISESKEASVYPNPLYGNKLHIETNSIVPIERVLLIDYSGKTVAEINNSVVPDLPNGMYLVRIIFNDQSEMSKKILITNK